MLRLFFKHVSDVLTWINKRLVNRPSLSQFFNPEALVRLDNLQLTVHVEIRVPLFLHFCLFIDRTHDRFRSLWLNLERAPGLEDPVELLVVEVHDLVVIGGFGTCLAD